MILQKNRGIYLIYNSDLVSFQNWELYNAELYLRQGDYSKARDFLSRCINRYDKARLSDDDASHGLGKETLVRAYILLADIQIISNNHGLFGMLS